MTTDTAPRAGVALTDADRATLAAFAASVPDPRALPHRYEYVMVPAEALRQVLDLADRLAQEGRA